MPHIHTGASPLGRTPRIPTLLVRAVQEPDQRAQFWALAVASQLIKEHLTTIEQALVGIRHPAQQACYRRARLAWTGCLVTLCARLDSARRQTTRD